MDVVSTKDGRVRGKIAELRNTEDGKPVYVYHRIPFAKSPTDALRFMPAQPADPWTEIIDGTVPTAKPMSLCSFAEIVANAVPPPVPKGYIPTTEDCLYLSVYSTCPQLGKNLPVMVWIYGGLFLMGAEAEYDASVIAGLNDVVVVVPNYRVGIFGFFSLGPNSPCKGNAGITDQQMALKWVQENIEHFGGDINNVTIFGESAGAYSVHLNIVSPTARGLFHKAISQSGQISMPGVVNSEENNTKVLEVILKHFKIEETENRKILEALQNIPAEELIQVQSVLEKERLQCLPIVDGSVLAKTPYRYLMDKEFPKIPYIIGCNNTEGSGLLGMIMQIGFETGLTEQMSRFGLRFQLSDECWEKCKEFYESEKDGDHLRYSKLFASISQDTLFAGPAIHDAKIHSESGSPLYFYLGEFQLKVHHDNEFGKEMPKKPDFCICDHADDIFMTFGFPYSPHGMPLECKFSEEEKVLSRKWMTYLTNFAKTGDPNKGCKVEKQWPEFKEGKMLILDHKIKLESIHEYRKNALTFWKEKMPSLIM